MNREEMEAQSLERLHEEHSEKAVAIAALSFLGSLVTVIGLVIYTF